MDLSRFAAASPCCTPSHGLTDSRPALEPVVMEATRADGDPLEGMTRLGGEFLMGTNDSDQFAGDGEGPVRKVSLDDFYIDPETVTNGRFKAFVDGTGYSTEAERFGWSYVFHNFV